MATLNYTYPTNSTLREVAQTLLPQLALTDPVFKFFPITQENTDLVMWEQMDNFTGLSQARGLGGQPSKVQAKGANRYQMLPGYYAEFMTIDEQDLTRLRDFGTYNGPIDLGTLVARKQAQLMVRQNNQITRILYTLLTTGAITAADKLGVTMYSESYNFQSLAGSAWSTPATGTPLADFRALNLLSRGYSVSFGANATALMNRITFNRLTANTNPNDLGGKRFAGLSSITGVAETNTILTNEDLPQIVINDRGYLNDTNTFIPFIPNNKIVVIGGRDDGAAIGSYIMTRLASNDPIGPGMFSAVVDSKERGQVVPRDFEVHLAHNGGVACWFPSAVAIMTVS